MIPDRAVITATTNDEALRLIKFLVDNGCQWPYDIDYTNWDDEYENTCYDIERNKQIMHCSLQWYEDRISEYDAGDHVEDGDWIPDDRSWLFISTDEFIARCTGCDEDSGDVDISALM